MGIQRFIRSKPIITLVILTVLFSIVTDFDRSIFNLLFNKIPQDRLVDLISLYFFIFIFSWLGFTGIVVIVKRKTYFTFISGGISSIFSFIYGTSILKQSGLIAVIWGIVYCFFGFVIAAGATYVFITMTLREFEYNSMYLFILGVIYFVALLMAIYLQKKASKRFRTKKYVGF